MTRILSLRIPTRLLAVAMVSLIATAAPVAAQPSQGKVLKAIRDASDLARTMPDAFGGLWLDESDVTFAFTHRATDEQVAEVLTLIEDWVPLTVVRVDWSEAELDATLEALGEAFDQEPPFLSGAGVSLRDNAVEVAIRPRYFEVCQAGLRARYGPVRLLFVSSEPDRGVPAPTPTPAVSPSPTPFPFALPEACTLPEGAPAPSDPLPPVDCRDEFPDVTLGREVTPEELAILCRDAYLHEGADAVGDYARAQPDYAGLVAHHGAEPGWTIWFTTDLARHEAELAPLIPDGMTARLLPAELNLRELEAIQARIGDDLPELLAMGMQIEEVGVDPTRNAVVVGLREDSLGALVILQQRYGPHVLTEAVGAT